jgi:hypothetical protein
MVKNHFNTSKRCYCYLNEYNSEEKMKTKIQLEQKHHKDYYYY